MPKSKLKPSKSFIDIPPPTDVHILGEEDSVFSEDENPPPPSPIIANDRIEGKRKKSIFLCASMLS